MAKSKSKPMMSDNDHGGDDEVIAVAGVTRVNDQKSESRVYRDHLRRDDDEPGDAQRDAQTDDQLRRDSGI